MIFAAHQTALMALLEQYPSVGKTRAPGSVLATRTGDCSGFEGIAALQGKLREGNPLSREQARTLVHYVDFLAAAVPDNESRPWMPDVLNLASKMRQEYAKTFGEKAYD